ncbi:MAG: CoA transferase, partial [Pseudomonadota bacterium]
RRPDAAGAAGAPDFGTPTEVRRPAPALGEHTEEALREAGLSEAEIEALR